MTFEEQIKIEREFNRRKEHEELMHRERNGELIYTRFCVWCNACKNGAGKHDYKLFEQYIKEYNIEPNWWQRKRIYENYFGFKFEYKDDKWVRVK